MSRYFLYSVAAFLLVSAAYFAIANSGGKGPGAPVLYYYELEKTAGGNGASLASVVMGYLFVALFSLLFFGLGAPFAMALEAAKYAHNFLANGMIAYDFAFAVPQLMAAYSAALLSEGILEDYEHRGIVFKNWELASILFLAGGALTLALYFARGMLA